MSEKVQTIQIVDCTVVPSVIGDAMTFAVAVGPVCMGWWLGSTALQWLGFVFFWLWVFGRGNAVLKKSRKTPQEAADWLRDEFGVTCAPATNQAQSVSQG